MGGRFRITTDDGQDLYFPEENAVAAMKALDRKGVKYVDARVAPEHEGAVSQPGAPEVIKGPTSSEVEAPAPAPAEKPSALAQLGAILAGREDNATQREDAMGGAADALSAIGGGMTGHLDQRLPFVGQDIKASRDAAREKQPALMAGMDALGAMSSPIGAVSKAAGPVGMVATMAATGGLQGAARSLGDANPDEDVSTQAWKALAQGAEAGRDSGLIGGGMAAAGALAKPLDRASVTFRRGVFPGTAGDNQKLVREMGTRAGLDFIENDLGRLPEKQGLTNTIIPQSASGLAKRAADKNKLVNGPEIGDSLSDAGYQLTPQPQPRDSAWRPPLKAPVVNRGAVDWPLAEQQKIAKEAPELTGQDASNFAEIRGRLRNQAVNTPMDLQLLKNRYEGGAFADGAVAGSMESSQAKVNEAAATATRDHLNDVMSQADPATYAKFKRANENYGDTAMVENLARAQAARRYAAPLLGAGLGGVAGYEVRHSGGDALAGAVVGGSLGQRYGADLAANVARLGERGASAAAEGSPGIARLGALLADEKKASAQDVSGETRGHKIPEAIQDALRDGKLGPYSDEFARAAMSDQPGALGVAYQKLSSDPQFAPYKRLLQEMTGGMQ